MPALFDREAGTVVDVPETAVTQAVASGRFAFKKGEMVKAIDADGEAVDVAPEKAEALFAQGFRFETAAEQKHREDLDKYDNLGGMALTALGSAANAASFGISDQILTRSGLVDPETLATQREVNPVSDIVGQVAGVAAPLALSGGTSLAGQALDVAGAGVKGVARLGGAAESAAAKVLGDGMVASTFAKAIGGAVEGAAYGAGQVVSEEALNGGDVKMTADQMLAHIGMSALVGGTATAGFHVIGKGIEASISAGRAAVDDVRNSINKTLHDTIAQKGGLAGTHIEGTIDLGGEIAGSETGTITGTITPEGPIHGTITPEAGAAETVTPHGGHDESFTGNVKDYVMRHLVGPEERNQIQETIYNQLDNIQREAGHVERHVFTNARPVETRTLLEGMDSTPALQHVSGVLDEGHALMARMAEDPALYSPTVTRKFQVALDGAETRIIRAMEEGGSAADIFESVNEAKRTIDQFAKFDKNTPLSLAEREAINEVRGFRRALADHLENPELYGQAAVRQEAFNSAFSDFKTAEKNFLKEFGLPRTETGQTVRRVARKKVNTFLNQVAHARSDHEAVLQTYLDASKNFFDQVETSFQGIGERAGTGEAQAGLVMNRAAVREAGTKLGEISRLRALDNGLAFLTMHSHGVLGQAMHAAAGSAMPIPGKELLELGLAKASMVSGIVSQGIRSLAAVGKISLDVGKAVDGTAFEAVHRAPFEFSKSTMKKLGRIVGPAATQILESIRFSGDMGQEGGHEEKVESERTNADAKAEVYHKRMSELTQLMSNPAALQERLANNTHAVSMVAPKTAQEMQARTVAALQFLYDKAPKNPLPPSLTVKRQWTPPESAVAKWGRYAEVFHNPMVVLDHVKAGTLAPEHVEAAQAFTPSLLAGIRQSFMNQLTELRQTMPYQQRAQLSLLFDLPLDVSFEPQNVASLQAVFQQTQAQAPQSSPQHSDVTLASRSMTKAEKTQSSLG